MRALLLLGLIVGLAATAGCATMTQSAAEVRTTYGRAWEYEFRQMADDWNYAWHVDRPSRLTRWQMR